AGENRGKFLFRHPGPFERAGALDSSRRRDHHHRVAAFVATRFEQERNIQYGYARSPAFDLGEKTLLGLAHQRMYDRFKLFDGSAIAQNPMPELVAVYLA